ncbi:putative inorganic phosphate cotransporter [Drosophila grimshawi]|uniref:Putative inorganic phosphate cotransporter n=1 Tax=Drosophila grimshawi TaxID=7222 RepID=B4JTR2_DROGR|nr:putative inorganic phosphate cotransporter [Drosophila grimshawi]XP_032596621.1 putative inorganic phosphate cotransporter [Drosophila grimshawi]XP_043070773.1 putative inorganic phosphate cotransporter [Drosophila grimshawi]EDV91491.1 GH13783 [Drosophila grimshawi]
MTDTDVQLEKVPRLGLRHLQALLLFLGLVVNTILQFNVGVAVVAMTNATSTNADLPYYNWTERQKSYVLSSFYWGSALTQFPGGYLCKRFGAKTVLFWGSFGSALLSAWTPQSIYVAGWRAYCAIRWLQGLCQGVTLPCIHQHLANWAPAVERTRLGAFAYTGFDCGNVLAMYAAGMLASSYLGWPGISYTSAALGVSWCLLWLLLGANCASEARCIGSAEKRYIVGDVQRRRSVRRERRLAIPWRGIFTSAPFYALLCARCADTWGLATMQAELPAYLNGVLGLEMHSNAFFSALPFLLMWAMCYVYLLIADVLLRRHCLSLTALRKTYNSIALWTPAGIMLALGFVDATQKPLAIALVTLSVGVSSAATIGSELNTIDLSPVHASILSGILSTFTNLVAMLTPLVVGVLVKEPTERSQWQVVFSIAAMVLFGGNVIYLIWGTAETQPWNDNEPHCEAADSDFEDAKLEISAEATANKALA